MTFASPALAGPYPVSYTVRNTFIDDLAGGPEEESPLEGIFSTWPRARPPIPIEPLEEDGELEDGELPDQPSVNRMPSLDSLEEGEVVEEGDEVAATSENASTLPRSLQLSSLPRASDNTGPTSATGPTLSDDQSQESPDRAGTLLTSIGSLRHDEGTCRPCAWLHKSAAGCRNAANCEYCHLCPPGEIKRRKRLKLQSRIALVVESRLINDVTSGGQQVDQACQTSPLNALDGSTLGGFGGAAVESASAVLGPASLTVKPPSVLEMEPCYIDVPGLTTLSSSAPAASATPATQTAPAPSAQAAENVPSLGSAGHARGSCRPCAWVYKDSNGCRNGASCEYCHLCPPGELKRRKQEKLKKLERLLPQQKTQ